MIIIISFVTYRIIVNINYKREIDYTKLSENELIEKSDENHFFSTHWGNDGGNTGIKGKMEEKDWDVNQFDSKRFSGIYTLQATKLEKGQSISFSCRLRIDEGKALIYIISPSKKIINTFNYDEEIFEITDSEDGIYLVRVVGDDFKGEIGISRNIK